MINYQVKEEHTRDVLSVLLEKKYLVVAKDNCLLFLFLIGNHCVEVHV